MDAYRQGATGNTVLEKTREIKKSHRVPQIIDPQPRGKYDRSRWRQIVMEREGAETADNGAETAGDGRDEIVFDQETFAAKFHQLLWTGNPRKNLVDLGKLMRQHGREAPRVDFADYLDASLYFDELVSEQRQIEIEEEIEEEMRGFWGDGRVEIMPEE